jgi:hypothetical protein
VSIRPTALPMWPRSELLSSTGRTVFGPVKYCTKWCASGAARKAVPASSNACIQYDDVPIAGCACDLHSSSARMVTREPAIRPPQSSSHIQYEGVLLRSWPNTPFNPD